ncbi:hypothetical protein T492DRAFT_851348, partial [Pavlovales sp. CCMP2436]
TLRECSGDYTNVTSLETRTELNQQPELPWVKCLRERRTANYNIYIPPETRTELNQQSTLLWVKATCPFTIYYSCLYVNQQPEVPLVKGRLTTIVTPRAAPGELAQTLFARECPAEGCPVPERVKATPTGMRRWSDASLWSCVKMSAVRFDLPQSPRVDCELLSALLSTPPHLLSGASIRQCSPIPDVVVPPTTRRQLSPRDKIESSNNSRRQLRASAPSPAARKRGSCATARALARGAGSLRALEQTWRFGQGRRRVTTFCLARAIMVIHICPANDATTGIVWKNSYQRTYSKPGFSGIFHDLDGSLTGFVNGNNNNNNNNNKKWLGWVTWDEPINHWADGVCDWTDSRFVNGE